MMAMCIFKYKLKQDITAIYIAMENKNQHAHYYSDSFWKFKQIYVIPLGRTIEYIVIIYSTTYTIYINEVHCRRKITCYWFM